MIPRSTDVVIVGAGPTGLALAIGLEKAGVDYLLVDRLAAPLKTSRAGVIHAHTLEALDRLGVGKELASRGIRVGDFAIRDRDREILKIRFDELPSAHP